jgi:exonuclease SbcD
LSDTHFEDGPRFAELISVLDVFINECRKSRVDLILHAGDLFHKKSTPIERLQAAEFLTRAAEIAPIVIAKGNHDAPDDIEIFNYLETKYPVVAVQRPGLAQMPRKVRRVDELSTRPSLVPAPVTIAHAEIDVHAVPWFDKAHLVASLPPTVDAEATTRMTIAAAGELLKVIQTQITASRQAGRIPVGVGHILVLGSEVSTGQTMVGVTVELSPHDLLDCGAAYFALGHVHKEQEWFDGRLAYSGSPIRQNFGETERKGFRLVEIESAKPGGPVRNDFVELPARRIELLEVDWTDPELLEKLANQGINDCFAIHEIDRVRDALVRFRYRIHPKDLKYVNEAAIEAILRADGAFAVKVEKVSVHETRVRSEVIAAMRQASAFDKLVEFWRVSGITVSEATAESVRQKIGLIEQGTDVSRPPRPTEPFPE